MKIAASVVLALAGVLALGQVDPIAPRKGAMTASFSFDWFRGGSGSTISTLVLVPGYFVTDRLELRLPLSYDRLLGTTETIYGVGARLHLARRLANGRNAPLDPFVGFVVEHATARGFREDLQGGQLGFHYFLSNQISLSGTLMLARDRMNGSQQTVTQFGSGFSVFFEK